MIVENGCLLDEITNNGDFDDSGNTVIDKNPHVTATSYVYYINEATEADAWTQDQFGASRPWIRQW